MTVYNFEVKQTDGTEKSLADYQGKVLLIVNTATSRAINLAIKLLGQILKWQSFVS